MSSEWVKKSEWVGAVIVHAEKMSETVGHVEPQLRGLMDMPSHVPRGAKEVALVTIVAQEQSFSFKPIMEALDVLEKLPALDWDRKFLVADEVTPPRGFSWKRQPFRQYESFADFYQKELASTWGKWSELKATYDKVVNGEITEEQGEDLVLRKHGGDRRSEEFKEENQGTNDTLKRGGNPLYIEARLKDDHPDLYTKVKSNELSHNAAAIQAGIRKKPTPLDQLRSAWKKASDEERRIFATEISTNQI